jgi:two-component system sensor histidine kinase AtoS
LEISEFSKIGQATGQLLDVALDLKDTVELFRELIRAEHEEEVNANDVVERVVQLLRPTARRLRVRIEMDLAPKLPLANGSSVRLQQVFANLLLNALQHVTLKMEKWTNGHGIVRVSTTCEAVRDRPIRVRFTDNGPGIHHQLWERIFALGFSTRSEGTGLGLFIARNLVESMDGKVIVERSAIPMGTTFRVELPESNHVGSSGDE